MSAFANPSGNATANAAAYVNAMLDVIGDRDPLQLLPVAPENLAAAMHGLDDAAMRRPEREGKWSIAQVVKHVADTELVYSYRYRMAVAHDMPEIAGFDQELWASRLHYAEVDISEALEQFRTLRKINVRFLSSLSPEERLRGGMHLERGYEDVERMMRMNAAHDLIHTRQIERIRAAIA